MTPDDKNDIYQMVKILLVIAGSLAFIFWGRDALALLKIIASR